MPNSKNLNLVKIIELRENDEQYAARLRFELSNKNISYVFQVSQARLLEHVYFGAAIESGSSHSAPVQRTFRAVTSHFEGIEHYNLSDIAQECPTFGTSDGRFPMVNLTNCDGNTTNVFRYQSYRVCGKKPDIDGLPSARGNAAQTLIVTLFDQVSNIELELFYTVYQDHDVISRSIRITNNCNEANCELNHALSATLDLPAGNYDLLHLRGTWSKEFNLQRMSLPSGRFVIDSNTGNSSSQHNPFIAITDKTTTEHSGKVIATALLYSGNFSISTEMGEYDSVRLLCGINPFNFAWQLKPNESFHTPEALLVFSDKGLNGMSQQWHHFINSQISPPQFTQQARPVYLNTWEAAYFDINEDKVLKLASRAKNLGIEMLVVDDGWFAKRNDDTTSLGDWWPDERKFPNGINTVAKTVNDMGLKFGLWFEPEMVNPESELYANHPDWVIQVPGRVLSKGRNQYILDLSQTQVVDYLFEKIDRLLSGGGIDYVKWDMNRTMTEIGSTQLPAAQQKETPHRYILGVYDLVAKITNKHNNILFENCASGGNRFDLGMLSYMTQGWLSDMSEPIGRLEICNGASYVFPPNVMASYIGPVPSHQNSRNVSIKCRGDVGFFCAARGLSLNEQDMRTNEQELRQYIELYKRSSINIVNSQFYRLIKTDNEVCWQLNCNATETVYIGYFHILSAPNLPFKRAYPVGLDDASNYVNENNGEIFNGKTLQNMGIALPYVHAMQLDPSTDYMPAGDFASTIITLRQQS